MTTPLFSFTVNSLGSALTVEVYTKTTVWTFTPENEDPVQGGLDDLGYLDALIKNNFTLPARMRTKKFMDTATEL